ncbi:MAG: OsmC family protein [Caulobacterales bacterium]
MSTYHATVDWRLDDGDFAARRYSRVHTLEFRGGLAVPGAPGTGHVPERYSREDAMDPESAFTGALSACHMLWFLDIAARAGFVVGAYRDEALGTMETDAEGKMSMTRVVLRPKIDFIGERRPTPQELDHLHHRAHEECFIANSVKSEVVVESR